MELLLGCGNSRKKQLWLQDQSQEWSNLITLDLSESCNPDIVFNLNALCFGGQLPFEAETFDELHAYNVLEHVGKQGSFLEFFTEFQEYWRVLKPGGKFFIITPAWSSQWAWGDPGHVRCFTPGTWSFLNQKIYETDVGKTSMTDYRDVWNYSFKPLVVEIRGEDMLTILEKEV